MTLVARTLSRQDSVLATCIVLIILPTIAVAVRFWSRAIGSDRRHGWDDWICLLALVFNNTFCGLFIGYTRLGFGKHASEVSEDDLIAGLKLLSGIYFIFDISIGLTKTSALCFYQRIFHKDDNKKFYIAVWVGHSLVIVWYLFNIINNAAFCVPYAKQWDASLPGYCTSFFGGYLATGLMDSIFDLYVLILPLPMIARLSMKPRRKLAVTAAFILGYICFILSVGRLTTILVVGTSLADDVTYKGVPINILALLESSISIVSICSPSWWYLGVRARKQGFQSLFTTHDKPSGSQIFSAWHNRRSQSRPGTGPFFTRIMPGIRSSDLKTGSEEEQTTSDVEASASNQPAAEESGEYSTEKSAQTDESVSQSVA